MVAKYILRDNSRAYDKGVLAEILKPIMGKGLIPADPETWKVRRRAIVPGFHKAWYNTMCKKHLIIRVLIVQCELTFNLPQVELLSIATYHSKVSKYLC